MATEQLPEDVKVTDYSPLEEIEIVDGRYQCMIELKSQSD